MDKFVIWGTGERSRINYIFLNKINANVSIMAFVDNNINKQGTLFNGIKVIAPHDIYTLEWDYIDIWSNNYVDEIQSQLINDLKIEKKYIKDAFYSIREKIIGKYKDNKEKDIRSFINCLTNKRWISIYNFQSENNYENSKAYFDETKKLYYIFFEGKRLYLSRKYSVIDINGEKFAGNFWGEQDLNSPHRYMDETVYVKEGDVLVDAGACEGNFALHNIEKVSKVYLIECDKDWVEALKCTFEPWKEKVVICNKFLDESDGENTICLDTLTQGVANYIKMDIEGAERGALLGAKRTLKNSKDVRCSICSYHRHGDEEFIKYYLNELEFNTYSSGGYMWFFLDEYAAKNLELRRGIVRAFK